MATNEIAGFPIADANMVPTVNWSFSCGEPIETVYECVPGNDRDSVRRDAACVIEANKQHKGYFYWRVSTERFGPRVVQAVTELDAIATYLDEYRIADAISASVRRATVCEIHEAIKFDEDAKSRMTNDSMSDAERRLYGLDMACDLEIDRFTH